MSASVEFEEMPFPVEEIRGSLQRAGRYDVAAWVRDERVLADDQFKDELVAAAYDELDLIPVGDTRSDGLEALTYALLTLYDRREQPTLAAFALTFTPARPLRPSALADVAKESNRC